MKTLVAGPWIGEFGWELMEWQGHVRALSEQYDKIICIGPKGSEYFYSDFCNKYLAYKSTKMVPDSWFGRDKSNLNNRIILKNDFVDKILKNNNINIESYDLFAPRRMKPYRAYSTGPGIFSHYKNIYLFKKNEYKQEFIKFGKKTNGYDLIIHARSRSCIRESDNWNLNKWNALVESLPNMKIASIGRSPEAFHVKGTVNILNLNMKDLCNILYSSKCIIGPQSGPIHLAALCGLKQIVWSPKSINKRRCLEDWNPFGANSVFFIDKNPEVEKVKDILSKVMSL